MKSSAMDFLTRKRRGEAPAMIVVFGDDVFMRSECRRVVRHWVLGNKADDLTFTSFTPPLPPWRDVLDELGMLSFYGTRRLVQLEDADKFVTDHRDQLFKYAEKPTAPGILLLDVKTWMQSTKLAKLINSDYQSIDANPPKNHLVASWIVKWADLRYSKRITKETADYLFDLVGPELGQLDQELAKLSTFIGAAEEIPVSAVQRLAAGARAENVFEVLAHALNGDLSTAFRQLDRLLIQGESEVGILAMWTVQLRKLLHVARLRVSGLTMDESLIQANVSPYFADRTKSQLSHLGRARMVPLYRDLLQADLALKGGSGLKPRLVLEQFLCKLRPAPATVTH